MLAATFLSTKGVRDSVNHRLEGQSLGSFSWLAYRMRRKTGPLFAGAARWVRPMRQALVLPAGDEVLIIFNGG